MPRSLHAVALLLVCLNPLQAQDHVTVDDTEVSYPVRTVVAIGDDSLALRLTGVGLREKAWFNVYAIASYVAADAQVKNAAALAAADVPKLLHLVMERAVDAPDISEAFVEAIEANHAQAKQTFAQEIKAFSDCFGDDELSPGQHIRFTHLPGRGVQLQVGERDPVVIEGLPFALAVWEIYFGASPVTEGLKTGLSSRL
jgi:hypothetical protein